MLITGIALGFILYIIILNFKNPEERKALSYIKYIVFVVVNIGLYLDLNNVSKQTGFFSGVVFTLLTFALDKILKDKS